jgi:hypothetical protein
MDKVPLIDGIARHGMGSQAQALLFLGAGSRKKNLKIWIVTQVFKAGATAQIQDAGSGPGNGAANPTDPMRGASGKSLGE